ncbi:MAG TPA: phosphoglycerate kinase [Verrucomicrobiales bacterium]|nr:phosphoglycerate kinase [Verrucomicrobiales bacterium]
MAKLTVRDLDSAGKRVLARVDYNVPLQVEGQGRSVADDTRIRGSLPTLEHLLQAGARVVLCSHSGRPKGAPDPLCSLRPAAAQLEALLGRTVGFVEDCVGEAAEAAVDALGGGEVLLLENLRFHPGETANDADFARALARLADVYVNDAFGACHRAHASTEGVTHFVEQAAMGFLVERELQYLQDELRDPERPFLVILGGAKVSDKIEVITTLMEKADAILIGGAMAYTFRKAQGYEVGDSLVEGEKIEVARTILERAQEKRIKFLLPANTLEAAEFREGAETRYTRPYSEGGGVSAGWAGVDIGDVAIEEFRREIASARTVVWNGPVGVFEIESFSAGTRAVAEALAASEAVTIIGGGDSVTAVNKFGLADRMSFLSTGGGASLELLEGKTLPGVAALTDRPE